MYVLVIKMENEKEYLSCEEIKRKAWENENKILIYEEMKKRAWQILSYIEFDTLEIFDELKREGLYSEYTEYKLNDILSLIKELKTKLNK